MPPSPLDLGPARAAYDEIEREVARTLAPRPARSSRADAQARAAFRRALAAALNRFARALDFTITVPGGHYSGLSNEALFEILADQGRDFFADTRRLRDHVRIGLLQAFEDADAVPLRLDVEQEAKTLILQWVAARMDGAVRDERLARLSPAYARRKGRAHPGQPIGKATGALYAALVERGRVHLT